MHYDYPCMRGYACVQAVFTALVLASPVKTRPYRVKICLTLQRFGTALVPWGQLHLKHKQYVTDLKPIDRDCGCSTCKHRSRAYINSLLGREEVACHLITIHNVYYQASSLC